MTLWEYKIVERRTNAYHPNLLRQEMNTCGQDGWELVATLADGDEWRTFYFKRPLVVPEADTIEPACST